MSYSPEIKEYVSKRLDELPGTWDEKTKAVVAEVKKRFGYSMNIKSGE